MFGRRSGTSVSSTPRPLGEFQTILPATVIGSFCKGSTWNFKKMSSLTAYERGVMTNTPPRLMSFEIALKTEPNVSPSATRQQGFLGCFLRSLRFKGCTVDPFMPVCLSYQPGWRKAPSSVGFTEGFPKGGFNEKKSSSRLLIT